MAFVATPAVPKSGNGIGNQNYKTYVPSSPSGNTGIVARPKTASPTSAALSPGELVAAMNNGQHQSGNGGENSGTGGNSGSTATRIPVTGSGGVTGIVGQGTTQRPIPTPVGTGGYSENGGPLANPSYRSPAQKQADALAKQYSDYIAKQQAASSGSAKAQAALATQLNDVNNTQLKQATANGMGMLGESLNQNAFDQAGIGINNQALAQQNTLNYQQFQSDQAYLGQQQQFANTGAANDQQYIGTQQNLAAQQSAQNQQYISSAWGLADQQYASDRGYLQGRIGLTNAQYGISQEQAGLSRDINLRANHSDSVARGASLSAGALQNEEDIKSQYGITSSGNMLNKKRSDLDTTGNLETLYKSQADTQFGHTSDTLGFKKSSADDKLAYQSTAAGLANQLKQSQLGLAETTAGINKNKQDSATNRQQQEVQFQSSLAQNDLAKKSLESMAKQLGIQMTDLQQKLASGITKNGLNLSATIQQLNDALRTGNTQLTGQLNQFLATLASG